MSLGGWVSQLVEAGTTHHYHARSQEKTAALLYLVGHVPMFVPRNIGVRNAITHDVTLSHATPHINTVAAHFFFFFFFLFFCVCVCVCVFIVLPCMIPFLCLCRIRAVSRAH